MKQYEKPQSKVCHIDIEATMLDLSIHNEEGNGIQRSKIIRFDEEINWADDQE